jgi:hypothetical protein
MHTSSHRTGVNILNQMYTAWNSLLRKALWWLVIIGLLAALPLAYTRHKTENSANQVEFVFDYRDLLDISALKTNPPAYVKDQLSKMKAAGVGSLAVYEATLTELQESRRIEMFDSHEVMALTQTPGLPSENFTYILFADPGTQQKLQPMIEKAFADLKVKTSPWSYKTKQGMIIEMGKDEASMKPMDPDPLTLSSLKEQGFQIVVRLSNHKPFIAKDMDTTLQQLQGYGVKRIIVDGEAVPGYSEEDAAQTNLKRMAQMLNKYRIGLAAIELLKEPQRGFSTLAKDTQFNVVRLHSFTEKDSDKLTDNLKKKDLDQLVQGAADRFVLAVKDRNIRMVFLNARPTRSVERGVVLDPLEPIYASLHGQDGAIPRIEKVGFTNGPAQAFKVETTNWQKIARFLILLGGVSLITLLIAYFIPAAALFVFVIGLVGALGLHTLSSNIYAQALALGVAISSPSIALMLAIRSVRSGQAAKWRSGIAYALWQLVKTTAISLIGVVYLISLLNQITYFLVIEQFRGVSLLHLVPIGIVALYLLFFSENMTYSMRLQRLKNILSSHIRVLWLVLAGAALAAGFYYLSRTGNAGQASTLEKLFRSFLENTLGVRPRTKEFLLAHPLFLLGAYLSVRYKNAVYLLLFGVIGQLSIVDTFAHLHTPIDISGIRIVYGLLFGTLFGLILIAVWEILTRSWKRWVPAYKG